MSRYDRNTIIEVIGEAGQNKFLNSSVLVAGAGGLGSAVIPALASAGIGRIGIIDNDVIELSNLNRQFIHKFNNIGKSKVESAKNWIKEYNPDTQVKTYPLRLDKTNYHGIIDSYDLIIDCFDSYKSKFLLNKIAIESNKPLIHGGVTEFYGQVTTIIPGKTACLGCIIPDYDFNAYQIKGVISPAVNTIGSTQAMEAVKTLLNIGDLLTNQLLTYNGLTMEFKKLNIQPNTACPVCSNINI